MKIMKLLLLMVALTVTSFALTSCGGSESNAKEATEEAEQGKEYTSAYVCPMHCEGSGSEEEGKCPVCGMDYVKNEEHTEDGHSH